jgi:Protein of unknown function (DUF2865)
MFGVSKQPTWPGQESWFGCVSPSLLMPLALAVGPGFFAYALFQALYQDLPAALDDPLTLATEGAGVRDADPSQKTGPLAGKSISVGAVGQDEGHEEDPITAYLKLRGMTEAVDLKHSLETPGKLAQSQPRSYRTVCVRLCDGYYFPISFRTTPDRFAAQEALCQSRCGSPARLYVYPNPGGTPAQMHDLSGTPYLSLKTAFRFHVKFNPACSCQPQPLTLAAKQRHRRYAKTALHSTRLAAGRIRRISTPRSPHRIASLRLGAIGRGNRSVALQTLSQSEAPALLKDDPARTILEAKYQRAEILSELMSEFDLATLAFAIPQRRASPTKMAGGRKQRSKNRRWRHPRQELTAAEITYRHLDPTRF